MNTAMTDTELTTAVDVPGLVSTALHVQTVLEFISKLPNSVDRNQALHATKEIEGWLTHHVNNLPD